jgi:acetyltransferase-like isoleucine patch superfamily enzyme
VLPGITIGKHVLIGAGSVVTKDIPPRAVAYGIPAEVKRMQREKSESTRTRSCNGNSR